MKNLKIFLLVTGIILPFTESVFAQDKSNITEAQFRENIRLPIEIIKSHDFEGGAATDVISALKQVPRYTTVDCEPQMRAGSGYGFGASSRVLVLIDHFLLSCIAPDSIIAKYQNDADRLALRKIYRNNLSFIDSIHIPKDHSDTALNALIAVYNATALPSRDTVIDMLNIHTSPYIVMDNFFLIADSNLNWMQQLKNGIVPTGDPPIDNLMSTYHLSVHNYSDMIFTSYCLSCKMVVFKSDRNYNLLPLTNLFAAIPGIYGAYPNGLIGGGSDIEDSVYTDHVELIYSVGWGDCLAGCIYKRHWKFKVDFDCSVEFAGSYGSLLPFTGNEEIYKTPVSIIPNPFKEIIIVNGISGSFDYTITNSAGQVLIKGKSNNKGITNLDGLNSGLYLMTIQTEHQVAVFKIIKE